VRIRCALFQRIIARHATIEQVLEDTMHKTLFSIILICAALFATGCGRSRLQSQSKDNSAASQTSENSPQPAPQPAAQPAPQAPSSQSQPLMAKSSPPPTAAQPPVQQAPQPLILPAGTAIAVVTSGPISSASSEPNQVFQATVAHPIVLGSKTVIPTGTPVAIKILESSSAGKIKGEGTLSLTLAAVQLRGQMHPVAASSVTQTSKGRGGRSAKVIGGTGAAGALIGGIAGGGKGAAIGALAGAGAGTAGAAMTGKRDVEIPAETLLSFKLTQPLQVR
jgi:hypothetical protein